MVTRAGVSRRLSLGVIVPAYRVSENGAVALSVNHSADQVEIKVEDSGPGLTSEQKDRLFEAFYTTKPNGTGLGLAVTKTLLEKMGASIEVNNGTAAGACFRISLPAGGLS